MCPQLAPQKDVKCDDSTTLSTRVTDESAGNSINLLAVSNPLSPHHLPSPGDSAFQRHSDDYLPSSRHHDLSRHDHRYQQARYRLSSCARDSSSRITSRTRLDKAKDHLRQRSLVKASDRHRFPSCGRSDSKLRHSRKTSVGDERSLAVKDARTPSDRSYRMRTPEQSKSKRQTSGRSCGGRSPRRSTSEKRSTRSRHSNKDKTVVESESIRDLLKLKEQLLSQLEEDSTQAVIDFNGSDGDDFQEASLPAPDALPEGLDISASKVNEDTAELDGDEVEDGVRKITEEDNTESISTSTGTYL